MDQIEHLATASLRPFARNARTHSKKQLRQIAASIERFGFTNPVLVDERNQIIAGHGRVAAAKLVGLKAVPCRRIEHMSTAEKRAYALADTSSHSMPAGTKRSWPRSSRAYLPRISSSRSG